MLDLTNLRKITDNDANMIHSLLDEFIRTTDDDAAQLTRAVENGESSRISFFSHRIKGSAAIVGAKELMMLSDELEQAGRMNKAEQFSVLLDRIDQCYQQISEEVNRYN